MQTGMVKWLLSRPFTRKGPRGQYHLIFIPAFDSSISPMRPAAHHQKMLPIKMWTPQSTFLLNFYTHRPAYVWTLTLNNSSKRKAVACSCVLASLIDAYWWVFAPYHSFTFATFVAQRWSIDFFFAPSMLTRSPNILFPSPTAVCRPLPPPSSNNLLDQQLGETGKLRRNQFIVRNGIIF